MNIQHAQEAHNKELLKKRGVVGTAVGEKWKDGVPTGEQAVLVFVEKKYSKRGTIRKYSSKDFVPPTIDGMPTDVIEVGRIRKQGGFKGKVRPIKPGYSVGHGDITAGTIGGVFRDKDDVPVILSNNHVIACENKAKAGDIIYQPGPSDSRRRGQYRGWPDPVANLPYIATLKRYVKIKRTGNVQDSATAKIHHKIVRDGFIDDLYPTINDKLSGFGSPKVGSQVQKCGRTTGYTIGKILGVNASFAVEYDFGTAKFDKCVAVTAISRGGDSGSIIQDMHGKAVALLFAGSPKVTIGNPMDIVQQHYGLKLWSTVEEDASSTITIDDDRWTILKHNKSTIDVNDGTIVIRGHANHHCCIERGIPQFKTINCIVNSGTDKGATWGPGLTVQWPNGYIKMNLRYGGSFGSYFNGSYGIDVGSVQPNKNYKMRLRKRSGSYIGEVFDSGKWYVILEVPAKLFPHPPQAIRLGKTDLRGLATPHQRAGDKGECKISGLTIH